jgi:hypothetical protein
MTSSRRPGGPSGQSVPYGGLNSNRKHLVMTIALRTGEQTQQVQMAFRDGLVARTMSCGGWICLVDWEQFAVPRSPSQDLAAAEESARLRPAPPNTSAIGGPCNESSGEVVIRCWSAGRER